LAVPHVVVLASGIRVGGGSYPVCRTDDMKSTCRAARCDGVGEHPAEHRGAQHRALREHRQPDRAWRPVAEITQQGSEYLYHYSGVQLLTRSADNYLLLPVHWLRPIPTWSSHAHSN
jgi:hypothetical protein